MCKTRFYHKCDDVLPKTGIIDYFGGQHDIENKIIRCVGNPEKRFKEDALRMLRAIRFSAVLSFRIEDETWKAIKKMCGAYKKKSVMKEFWRK